MTRLAIDTPSAPAWEPGAAVEVRLLADDVEWTVAGTLAGLPPEGRGETDPIREALDDQVRQIAEWAYAERQAADRKDWPQADRWRNLASGATGVVKAIRAALSAPDPVSETAEAPTYAAMIRLANEFDAAAQRWRDEAEKSRREGAVSSMSGYDDIPSPPLSISREQTFKHCAKSIRDTLAALRSETAERTEGIDPPPLDMNWLREVIHELRWCKASDLLHAIAHDDADEEGYRFRLSAIWHEHVRGGSDV